MTKRVKVILNPITGHPSGTAKVVKIEQALQQAQLDYSLAVTKHPQHGIELARQAALEGWPIIAAAGGDGTVSEVVNGIMQTADEPDKLDPKLGIIPTGTANDLATALQLPKDIQTACQRLANGKSMLIDVAQVNGHFFVNNSAVGLESVVTVTQNNMRWMFKGIPRYIMAAFKSILTAKNWDTRIEWPSGCYEGTAILVSVGNSPRTGGVFYMTPDAVVDDGLIDFVYGVGMSRWRMVTILPHLLRGSHINHSMVIYRQTKQLKITTSPPTPIQADGEIIDHEATEISYSISPKKLQVII
ncbi:diacylglycerol kinase family lipid kinase [Anaerolineales bacterium HSG25]|nr:diacylglycerol kinase family lipid kinase [Anaerolineales bacterium HSG25]